MLGSLVRLLVFGETNLTREPAFCLNRFPPYFSAYGARGVRIFHRIAIALRIRKAAGSGLFFSNIRAKINLVKRQKHLYKQSPASRRFTPGIRRA
jgi:hypothetical protein